MVSQNRVSLMFFASFFTAVFDMSVCLKENYTEYTRYIWKYHSIVNKVVLTLMVFQNRIKLNVIRPIQINVNRNIIILDVSCWWESLLSAYKLYLLRWFLKIVYWRFSLVSSLLSSAWFGVEPADYEWSGTRERTHQRLHVRCCKRHINNTNKCQIITMSLQRNNTYRLG